jgi:hypothetical protein
MKKSRRAPRPKREAAKASILSGGTSGKGLGKPDKDLEMQLTAWKLLSKKILFFFALCLSGVLCVFSLIVLAGAFPLRLRLGAGVYLASVGMALLRHLLGVTPPLSLLITELVKVLTVHKKVNPLE